MAERYSPKMNVQAMPDEVEFTSGFPVLVKALTKTPLSDWLSDHADLVAETLLSTGALLFRGFPKLDLGEFEGMLHAFSGPTLDYEYRSNDRTRLSGNVFTSTEYPATEVIPPHNEMSYFSTWPKHIWFMCDVPPAARGETPIVDSRVIYQQIPASIRRKFENLGVRYVRNIGPELDLRWQDVFQTNDRPTAERFCKEAGIGLEWIDDERVRTWQHRPAAVTHSETGERVWFNQAHLFHYTSSGSDIAEWLVKTYGEGNLPRNAYYGDGSLIELAALEAIRETYERYLVDVVWNEGDVLVLDNVLIAHARNSFTPPRRILVGMAGRSDAA